MATVAVEIMIEGVAGAIVITVVTEDVIMMAVGAVTMGNLIEVGSVGITEIPVVSWFMGYLDLGSLPPLFIGQCMSRRNRDWFMSSLSPKLFMSSNLCMFRLISIAGIHADNLLDGVGRSKLSLLLAVFTSNPVHSKIQPCTSR